MRLFLLLSLGLIFAAPSFAKPRAVKTKRITLDVQNADVQNVVRLIADVAKINVVLDDSVSGKVSVKLRNVKWKDALNIVLRTKGLGLQKYARNLYRVAPQATLQKEKEDALKQYAQSQELGKLRTQTFRVNYAKASEIAKKLETFLTPRGSVSFDERTNTVFVKDVEGSAVFSMAK